MENNSGYLQDLLHDIKNRYGSMFVHVYKINFHTRFLQISVHQKINFVTAKAHDGSLSVVVVFTYKSSNKIYVQKCKPLKFKI